MLRKVDVDISNKVIGSFDSLTSVRPSARLYGEIITMIAANNDSSAERDRNLAMFITTVGGILKTAASITALCERVLAACIRGTSLTVDDAIQRMREYICTFDISEIFGGHPIYDALREEYRGGIPDEQAIRTFITRQDNRNILFSTILKFGLGYCIESDARNYPALNYLIDAAEKIGIAGTGDNSPALLQPLVQYTFNTQDAVGFAVISEEYSKTVHDTLASVRDKAGLVSALGQYDGTASTVGALVDSVNKCITMSSSTTEQEDAALQETPADELPTVADAEETHDELAEPDVEQTDAEQEPQNVPEGTAGNIVPDRPSLKYDDAISMNLDRRTAKLFANMAHNDEQLKEALDHLDEARFPAMLSTYHPGFTEQEVANILDNHTRMASHRPYKLSMGDTKEKKTILIPPAFKVDQFYAIWTRAVVGGLGFPFINFTCPTVMTLIRGSDPKQRKDAYKKLKAMFKQCGLKKPVDTLKEFAHAKYRNCSLAALSVDAEELYNAAQGSTVTAGVVDTYSKTARIKGSIPLPLEFLTVFYTVLSPINAVRQYSELCGMTVQEYHDYLVAHGKPPVYILNPKKVLFKRGPKAGLLHQLFSSKVAPVLVRARVGSHEGGFMIPERIADAIFIE